MANWNPPTAKSAGWSPRGSAMRRFGESMRQFGTDFSAQLLAIKQWEAEKEEKRQQRMREQAAQQVQALAQQQALEQQRIYDESMLARAEQFKREEAEKERAHDIKMAWLKQKGGEEGQEEKWQADLDKHLDRLGKLQTDFAQRRADEIRAAINAGDVAALYKIQKEVAANRDLMRTYTRKTTTKEGKPTTVMEESNDINELTGALYYITRQMEQKYGKPEMQAEQPQKLDRNSVEFRADRNRIIQLLRGGRKNDAFLLMRKWQYNDEEVRRVGAEASKPGFIGQFMRGGLGGAIGR